ncbi:MAG: DUF4139 domain-containing protein [Planctomycetaceae bacterium]|nr:DUF4139 domain-containing protein [Planctomycetaceae bacterium]
MKNSLIVLAILLFPVCLFAAESNSVSVTVYNSNFGVVKEQRMMDFEKGVNTLKFTDVAASIDPTSVSFQCLSSPGKISILEQNYEYDLVGTQSLLNKYIDKVVIISIKGSGADAGSVVDGVLLAARDNNLIIKDENNLIQIIAQDSVGHISLRSLPEGLITRPTLVWLANSETEGSEKCQVTYTTENISWKADYSAILNADENGLNFSGWVTIDNQSGAAYKDAKVKLIAGDVRRITPPQQMMKNDMVYATRAVMAEAAGFEEKSFMEYHLYTLGRPSTINNNQTKQIEFIAPVENIPAKKIYLYEPQKDQKKVQIKFEFENKKELGLGIALPKGKVRVFKKDTDGELEFVGEDEIDHTPNKEKLSLYIGDAFDITVEYKILDSKVVSSSAGVQKSRWEKRSIELRNRKDSAVTIFVDEKFSPWVNWKIEDSTHPQIKKDATTARFTVEIPADSNATLEYSVMQKW